MRLIDGSSGGGSVTLMLDNGYTYLPPLLGMHDIIASLSEIPVVAAALGPGTCYLRNKGRINHICSLFI